MKRINFLGCPIDSLSMNETVTLIDDAIKQKAKIHHVVVNVAKLVNMRKDKNLRDSVINCDIINADGQPIVWASKLLKVPLPERVAGIDLMEKLVELAYKNDYKIFFLGAEESVVKKVVLKYAELYSPNIIAGYRNGYFYNEVEKEVAEAIAKSGADMLFVAISSPKKEIFINKYKDIIKVPFIMGVGGSFDVVAGITKRAPLFIQKSGLEWLFRIYQEPKRMWKRYATTNPSFIYLVFVEKIKQIWSHLTMSYSK